MILTQRIPVLSEGDFYVANITDQVREIVAESGVQVGSTLVFYKHTTGALMIIEYEAGILVDLKDVLEKIVPVTADYKHHLRGYDENGAAHVRTALLSVSLTIPILDGGLLLGTYQEIVMVDMDPGCKERSVIVQVAGE